MTSEFYFDEKAANRVSRFFETFLVHCKGRFAGQKFKLAEWQLEHIIRPLFGWKRANGTRRYKKLYLEVPKKNGKSTLASGIALYLLIADNESSAEIYSVAGDKKQASIVFNEALNMVKSSEELSDVIQVSPSIKRLAYPKNYSYYEVLSSDAETKEGYNVHGLIFDEYHVQKNNDLRNVLEYSGISRTQPLFLYLTTAGDDIHSPCYDEHCYAQKILSGEVENPHYLPVIYGATSEDDWRDEKTWIRVNPSFGEIVRLDELRESYAETERDRSKVHIFKRYRVNMWEHDTSKWIDMDKWAQNLIQDFDMIGKCYAAIDLASTQDTNSLALFFPDSKTFVTYMFVPSEQINLRHNATKFRYDKFVESGELIVIPGEVMDYDVLTDKIDIILRNLDVEIIACDPYNATTVCTNLKNLGYNVQYYRQNMANMSMPAKTFHSLLLQNEIHILKNDMLTWMASNVVTITDKNDNIGLCKKKSKDKIDGIVTCVMCIGLWLKSEESQSPYSERGIRYI